MNVNLLQQNGYAAGARQTVAVSDKGLAMSVRPWDHQLRQAILLAAPYDVVASAPVDGFLHQTNVLDTLGDDESQSPCHLNK